MCMVAHACAKQLHATLAHTSKAVKYCILAVLQLTLTSTLDSCSVTELKSTSLTYKRLTIS